MASAYAFLVQYLLEQSLHPMYPGFMAFFESPPVLRIKGLDFSITNLVMERAGGCDESASIFKELEVRAKTI